MFELINKNTWIGFGVAYTILLVAILTIYLLKNKLSYDSQIELKNRVKTWFYIISGFLAGVSLGQTITVILFALISTYAFKEYLKSTQEIQTSVRGNIVISFAYLMIPLQYFWIAINWNQMGLLFIPIYLFLSLPLFLMISGQTNGFLKSTGTIYWGFMACVFCISHVPMLLTLNSSSLVGVPSFNGVSMIFYLLFLTGINDVFQYIWGKKFGKTKIVPLISPNKTWEGFLGGVLSTTLLATLLSSYFTPLNLVGALGVGLLISVGGFIGDICMSAIKRDLGIKDYSSFLPGHGGILDRMDSLIYTAPLFYHYVNYLYF